MGLGISDAQVGLDLHFPAYDSWTLADGSFWILVSSFWNRNFPQSFTSRMGLCFLLVHGNLVHFLGVFCKVWSSCNKRMQKLSHDSWPAVMISLQQQWSMTFKRRILAYTYTYILYYLTPTLNLTCWFWTLYPEIVLTQHSHIPTHDREWRSRNYICLCQTQTSHDHFAASTIQRRWRFRAQPQLMVTLRKFGVAFTVRENIRSPFAKLILHL